MCALHRRLDQGIALMETLFGRTTMGELVAESDPSRSLCNTSAIQRDESGT
jgi:hypothetical protein